MDSLTLYFHNHSFLFILLGIVIFIGLAYAGSLVIAYLQKNSHNRLLNSREYLPEEEIQTLKQVLYLLIITFCFVDILYSIIFWASGDFYLYFLIYDFFASVIATLALKRETLRDKVATIFLIPLFSLLYMSFNDHAILMLALMAIHFLGLAYVIEVYYAKFINYTESNGLGISILLLFGIVFFSFISTSFAEGKGLLDSLVMVSNAFTSNGYAVLGETAVGKINSLFLVWGGYILSGVGTATLTAALLSRHFNKRFEKLEEKIDNINKDKNND